MNRAPRRVAVSTESAAHPGEAARFRGRLEQIDVLRGLSILAVVLLHISLRMRFAGFSLESALPPWLFHLLFWNGNNGVTVFFAVSGFLITHTSLRRYGSLSQFQVLHFYRIRFARIAPLLLILLATLTVLHLVGADGFVISADKASLPRALFAALTFHLNWLEGVHGYLPASWDVLWSLSVEEMFYLLYPVACLLCRIGPWGNRFFVALLIAFVAMGPFARTVWTTNEIWREKSYLGGMDAIALGCLSAILTASISQSNVLAGRVGFLLHGVQYAGAGLIFLVALWPSWGLMSLLGRTGLDGSVLALGTCLVMIATVLRGKSSGKWSGPIRWLGRNSYEVYLTHEFVVIWITAAYARFQAGPLALWFAAAVLLSAIFGNVVARYYSEPLNQRLRRNTTDRGSSPETEASAKKARQVHWRA